MSEELVLDNKFKQSVVNIFQKPRRKYMLTNFNSRYYAQ